MCIFVFCLKCTTQAFQSGLSFHCKIKKECLSCRENAAIFNMSYFGKFYLVGPDAQKAVNWICTNDVQKPLGEND